jgi:hypothetical protein
MTILGRTTDPDGRLVELTKERWNHIIDPPEGAGHPELEGLENEVLEAVTEPDRRLPGTEPGEEWFYRAEVGPSRWLKVVVIYEEQRGFIVAAHGRRSMP